MGPSHPEYLQVFFNDDKISLGVRQVWSKALDFDSSIRGFKSLTPYHSPWSNGEDGPLLRHGIKGG